jgi:hypothetical protein
MDFVQHFYQRKMDMAKTSMEKKAECFENWKLKEQTRFNNKQVKEHEEFMLEKHEADQEHSLTIANLKMKIDALTKSNSNTEVLLKIFADGQNLIEVAEGDCQNRYGFYFSMAYEFIFDLFMQ